MIVASTHGARAKAPDSIPAERLAGCNVIWDSPSENSHGSMPLGNGDVGINAWVEPGGDLVFYVSKTDAWDENGRLCKIGRARVGFDPPLPIGERFRQELKLREGSDRDRCRHGGLGQYPAGLGGCGSTGRADRLRGGPAGRLSGGG